MLFNLWNIILGFIISLSISISTVCGQGIEGPISPPTQVSPPSQSMKEPYATSVKILVKELELMQAEGQSFESISTHVMRWANHHLNMNPEAWCEGNVALNTPKYCPPDYMMPLLQRQDRLGALIFIVMEQQKRMRDQISHRLVKEINPNTRNPQLEKLP